MSQPLLSFEDARAIVLDNVDVLPGQPVPLCECLGLVLAADVVSQDNIPYCTNSAMDGFAVVAEDLVGASSERPVILQVVETIEAGQIPARRVERGTCARIMTGAIMPEGADAVVRVEDTEPSNGSVSIRTSVQAGSDVRAAGEDIAAGETALTAGTELRPYEIGLLAAVGVGEPLVIPRPRVALIATGSELLPLSHPLSPGKVRNSNGPALYAQCIAVGASPVDFGIVEDADDATRRALEKAAATCDVVVTAGAVSMGERDRIRPTMERLGEVLFWRVAMRPGSPLLFGRLGGKPCFCLPGNPASAMLTFELFARPALRKMMGHKALFRPVCQGRAAEAMTPRQGFTMFLRARVERRNGEAWVRRAGPQGSGMHKPFARADCLAVLEGESPLRPGDPVPFIPLDAPER